MKANIRSNRVTAELGGKLAAIVAPGKVGKKHVARKVGGRQQGESKPEKEA